MKKEEKKVVRESYVTTFVAIDGTEFNSQQDCEKYEKSVECSISVRLNDITISRQNQETVFLQGNEDCDCQIVRPRNAADIDSINQLVCLIRNQDPNSITDKNLAHDENIGECVVICYSYDHDWVWLYTESQIRNHWAEMFATND